MRKKRKTPKDEAPKVEAVPVPDPIPKRPTIQELEAILNAEGEETLEILPNGEVRRVTAEEIASRPKPKPLTMKEKLGGEYAVA